jgi:RNA polymerase sigma factor (TIGR02999 family)
MPGMTAEDAGRAESAGEFTVLLEAARAGDEQGMRALFGAIYEDLRRLAGRHARAASPGPGATSLVHELFVRLARRGELAFADRGHFFAVMARALRQIVLDDVRARGAGKRGAGRPALDVTEVAAYAPAGAAAPEELLALDDALRRLAREQPRLAETVEWHFFGGLTFGEIAEARGVSERTVLRDWRSARALLHASLEDGR